MDVEKQPSEAKEAPILSLDLARQKRDDAERARLIKSIIAEARHLIPVK